MAKSKLISKRNLVGVVLVLLALPIAVWVTNQQQETRSRASEPAQAIKTQTNELGTVTLGSIQDLSDPNLGDGGKERVYLLGLAQAHDNWCDPRGVYYKVNGLRFFMSLSDTYDGFCLRTNTNSSFVHSTANCNTLSLIPPAGYRVSGIGYKRWDRSMASFRYVDAKSVKLCDNNYLVTFSLEPN